MRITLLSAILLLSLHTCFAAKPPARNITHEKKGTIGLISGLLLGPVGLGGVFLFTHNHAQRKAAKKGCVIFATVVVTAALCWLIVLGAKSGGGSGSSNHSSASGSIRGSGSGRGGGSVHPVGSSGGSHSGSGSSNSDWASNINLGPTGSSTSTKKKLAPGQLPTDLPTTIILMH